MKLKFRGLFRRTRGHGSITIFDPPGSNATFPRSINPGGEITGYYYDATGQHGFVRAANGTITTFDAPGAGPNGTFPLSINPAGDITRNYVDAKNIAHGLLRNH